MYKSQNFIFRQQLKMYCNNLVKVILLLLPLYYSKMATGLPEPCSGDILYCK